MFDNSNDYSNNEESQSLVCTEIHQADCQLVIDTHNSNNSNEETDDYGSSEFFESEYLIKRLIDIANGMDLDPLSKYALDSAYQLLIKYPKFSLETLIDIMQGQGNLLMKEGTLRKKLGGLVEKKLLSSIAGQGRTPTYYFLPRSETIVALSPGDFSDEIERDLDKQDDIDALKKTLAIYLNKQHILEKEIEEKEALIKQARSELDKYKIVIDFIQEDLKLSK